MNFYNLINNYMCVYVCYIDEFSVVVVVAKSTKNTPTN